MNPWNNFINDWQTYLTAAGAPVSTRDLRAYHVRRFARECDRGPWAVTTDDLIEWLAGHDWSANTRRTYRQSFRSFWSWGVAAGHIDLSPANLIPPVRVPRGRPRPAPEAAVRFALTAADDRERLAVQLAAYCGLRRGEIARARRDDLERDLSGWSLRVTGKGGHVRMVPLPDDLAAAIRQRPEGWLFPSSHGGHLTPHHLGKLITRCLPEGLTTHTLRHRCATVAYSATHDLRAVQELLGHAKPETTAIYTLVPDNDVRAAMLAAAA